MPALLILLMMSAFPARAGALPADPLAESRGTALAISTNLRKDFLARAAEPCYRFHRKVEWRNAEDPRQEWKLANEWTSYVSTSLVPDIEGILTPWSHQVRAEVLWMTDLALSDAGLGAMVAFEKNEFPLDDTWDEVWRRRVTFPLDKPVVFESRILERDFRVTALLGPEPVGSLCRMPALPPMPRGSGSSRKEKPRPM